MKCSKCGYIGFESAERCRNCGYEFALDQSFALPDLPMRRDSGPVVARGLDDGLDDFALIDAAIAPPSAAVSPMFESDRDRTGGESRAKAVGQSRSSASLLSASKRAPGAMAAPAPTAEAESDLLLFDRPVEDDMPLITKPSPPRSPLSVRRATPEVSRVRAVAPRSANLDLGLERDPPLASQPALGPSEGGQSEQWSASDHWGKDAGVWRRALALTIDAAILLAIDVAVIDLTMQICGVTIAEFGLLPKGPLVAFLVVQNVGYLVAFTAGGQTLGKMAAGIKVVTIDPDEPLDLACALKRTVAWLVLALPGGIGLLSAVFSDDHRGLHDRFAGTRVVRA